MVGGTTESVCRRVRRNSGDLNRKGQGPSEEESTSVSS